MSDVDLEQLNDMQLDVLKEIGNIGAGNATTALSTMLNVKMDMSVPNVALFIFDTKSAHHLVNSLMLQNDDVVDESADFTDMEMSALNEIGNIASGSYLTAISSLTKLNIIATVPQMTIDMIGALLSVPASEFGKYGDKLLLIQTQFGELDFVKGYFLLIPELESYDKILRSLGVIS